MWHASIAKLDSNLHPRFIAYLVPWKRRVLEKIGEQLLDGVGTGETYILHGKTAVHVRRSLSPTEIAGLSAEWLAIPAVDIAG